MHKIIRLKKSVFDQRHPDLTIEQAMERFLEYLVQDIPELWNYSRVINKAS